MIKKILKITPVVLLFWATGCNSIHKDGPRPGPGTDTKVGVELTFEFDRELNTVYSDGTRSYSHEDYDLRYIIQLYEGEGFDKFLKKEIKTTGSIKDGINRINALYELDATKYSVVVWADYVTSGQTKDKFYTTSDLSAIKHADPYTANHDMKDAFVGSAKLDLTSFDGEEEPSTDVKINMDRPFGVIEVITVDMQEYYMKHRSDGRAVPEDLSVEVRYAGYFPSGYNALDRKPNDSRTNVEFDSELLVISEEEALITLDYVFVNGTETVVTLAFDVLAEGVVVNTVGEVKIPVRKGQRTVVRGEFLTKEYSGGINIDPDYEGDIEITIPD